MEQPASVAYRVLDSEAETIAQNDPSCDWQKIAGPFLHAPAPRLLSLPRSPDAQCCA